MNKFTFFFFNMLMALAGFIYNNVWLIGLAAVFALFASAIEETD